MLASLIGGRAASFLLGPAGKVLMVGLALGLWTVYQRADATADCEAAELRQELAAAKEQLEIANRIAQDARNRANETEQDMARIQTLYDDLQTDLANDQTVGTCPLDPSVIRRLLAIQ